MADPIQFPELPFPELPPGYEVQVDVTEIRSRSRIIGFQEPYGDGVVFYPDRGLRRTSPAFAVGGDTRRLMP